MEEKKSNKPSFEIKDYPFKVACFEKTSKDGKPYKTLAITKSEKDQKGEWNNATIYVFSSDAPKLASVISAAYQKGLETNQTNPSASTPAPEKQKDPFDDEIPF